MTEPVTARAPAGCQERDAVPLPRHRHVATSACSASQIRLAHKPGEQLSRGRTGTLSIFISLEELSVAKTALPDAV